MLIISLIFFTLIFLFKYTFVVQNDIENQIYDSYKNRELIVYDNSKETIEELKKQKEIKFIYQDYQEVTINIDSVRTFILIPLIQSDMPKLIVGDYPKTNNEIILPEYTLINEEKTNLSDYLNKDFTVIINNEEEYSFKITGIFKVENNMFNTYYNLEYINSLLDKTKNNLTGNLRCLVDHYNNVEEVISKLSVNANLYDISGLEEIDVYKAIYNLVLLFVILIVFFVIVIIIVVSSILYYDTKQDRIIQFALGCNNHMLVMNYINYYFKLLIISLSISMIIYFITTILYNQFIFIDNLILNDLLQFSVQYQFLVPIILLIVILLLLLYFIIRLRLSRTKY